MTKKQFLNVIQDNIGKYVLASTSIGQPVQYIFQIINKSELRYDCTHECTWDTSEEVISKYNLRYSCTINSIGNINSYKIVKPINDNWWF